MLCAERMQRIVQAIILGLIMGLAGSKMFAAAFIVMLAMMVMLMIAGLTGFCPGLLILKSIFPPCKCQETKE
ncbi:hypothetical protein MNB_SV-10-498 [hydrothermal vent metagenome]|uniref:Rhodanese-related sulfurtransferase n=1 Tax=hydrothermal vent metagenome TaxID=652676 RepID=A0A1W1BUM3_9ZZZZ|nr:hypothetical protein [Sulfurovum sp.]